MSDIKMALKSEYENNKDFKEYVDKFSEKHGKTVDETLECAIVWDYYKYSQKKLKKYLYFR